MIKNRIDDLLKELKPCPFCGKTGRLNHRMCNGATHSLIICEGCGAETKSLAISTEYSSDEEVINLWNRRKENEI